MAYVKQNWENLPSENTPISAARLAHMETQYDEAVTSSAVVNVRDFGAIGDGVADDATAIQDAISAAGNGETVVIPSGTYRLGSTIRAVRDGLKLVASQQAVLKRAHTGNLFANGPKGETVKGWGGIQISGGVWDCDGVGFPPWGSVFVFGKASNITISNLHAKNVAQSHIVEWAGITNGLAQDVTFSGYVDQSGTRGASEAFQIERITSTGFPEFSINDNTPSSNIRFVRCFQGEPDPGYSRWPVGVGAHAFTANAPYISNISVQDCDFGECLRSVVRWGPWLGGVISNVRGRGGLYGLEVECSSVLSLGLSIRDVDVSSGTSHGLSVLNASDIRVSGGSVTGESNGVRVSSGTGVSLSGTRVRGVGFDGALVTNGGGVFLSDCEVQGGHSVRATGASRVRVSGCRLLPRTGYGVFVNAENDEASVLGNVFETPGNGSASINFQNSKKTSAIGNIYPLGVTSFAINMTNSSTNLLSNVSV